MLKQFEHNHKGKDYIIGDVHNRGDLLEELVQQLGPEDRLFLVGDLFDRGQHPLRVYQALQDPRVFSARGNHENLLLTAFADHADPHDIYYFLLNGGAWVLANPEQQKELKIACYEGRISLKDRQKAFHSYAKIQGLDAILDNVAQLPYLIRVGAEGPDGFIVCHADLPLSDSELDELFQSQNGSFNEDQIHHLTWARLGVPGLPPFALGKRNANSLPVYCGHNIIQNPEDALRRESNHINLDGGAFRSHCFIVANHSDKNAFLLSLSAETNPHKELNQQAADCIKGYWKYKHPIVIPAKAGIHPST